MRPSYKYALIFAVSWIVLKYLFFQFDVFQDSIVVPGLINNLFLVLAVSLGLYFEKKKEGFSTADPLSDIKNGMRSGMIYILIVCGFMYYYYNSINPEFIEHRIEQKMDNLYVAMERDSFVDSLKIHNPKLETKTKTEILEIQKADLKGNMSAFTMFIFSLLGLLIMALSYAILITLIFRKVLFREYYNSKQKQ